jgi:1,4-dihydroxy-2-naphthoate octaprenyltransferase
MATNRWVLGARPRTLPAAVVPVLVGTACAWDDGLACWRNAVLALVVSLALQVATNYANDYSDGKRGTDDPSKRVGPPRLVGNGLATADEVKRAMILAFGVALVAGGVLVVSVGWELIPVGVAAVAAGYFYTGGPKPYGYLGLGEAFVFVFFGLVAAVGSTYVQLERITWLSVGCGVMVGCLATALLVVNNLRDIPGDTASGKRTLAVKLGDQRTRVLYVVLMALPYLILPFVAGLGGRPVAGLAFAGIMFSGKPVQAVLGGASGPGLIPVLGATGRAQLVFGVLLTTGLIASTYFV